MRFLARMAKKFSEQLNKFQSSWKISTNAKQQKAAYYRYIRICDFILARRGYKWGQNNKLRQNIFTTIPFIANFKFIPYTTQQRKVLPKMATEFLGHSLWIILGPETATREGKVITLPTWAARTPVPEFIDYILSSNSQKQNLTEVSLTLFWVFMKLFNNYCTLRWGQYGKL